MTLLKRVTIMLDEDLLRKLRKKQASMIRKDKNSVSLSKVINEYLSVSLKNGKSRT